MKTLAEQKAELMKAYKETGRKAFLDKANRISVEQYLQAGGQITMLPAKGKPQVRTRSNKTLHEVVKSKTLDELIEMLRIARLSDIEAKYL
jgi:hypothetical protein